MTKKELIEWNIEMHKKLYDIDINIHQRFEKRIESLLTIKECYDYVQDGTCFSCEMNKLHGRLL